MLNKEMSAGTNAEQSTNDETRLPSSPTCGNTNVVRSPNFVSTEKAVEEFEESKKNGYGRFVLDENGKVTGVELATLSNNKDTIVAQYGKDGMTYFTGEFTPSGEGIFSKYPNKE